MPIIITGRGQEDGGTKFVNAFEGMRDMRMREDKAKLEEARYAAEFKKAQKQVQASALYAQQSNAAAQAGLTPAQADQAQGAVDAFLKMGQEAGMLPDETVSTYQNMTPDSSAVFGQLSDKMKVFHLKREAGLQQEQALQQALQQAQGDVNTTRALEVSGRVPEGTADLIEQQLQAGELDPLELREATLKAEQEAAAYHGSVAESERMVKQWRIEQDMRIDGEPLPPAARGIIAELETALRLRDGHPGMDPIDFGGFAKRFRRAAVPPDVEDEIAFEAVEAVRVQAEQEARLYADEQAERAREEFGGRPGPSAPVPSAEPSAPAGEPTSLKSLKKTNPEQLQQAMGSLKAYLSELAESGDASTTVELWKKLREKAKELGVTATRAELEKHMNFEVESGQDYPRKDLQKKLGPMAGGRN